VMLRLRSMTLPLRNAAQSHRQALQAVRPLLLDIEGLIWLME
jgi:hypothetical protein